MQPWSFQYTIISLGSFPKGAIWPVTSHKVVKDNGLGIYERGIAPKRCLSSIDTQDISL